MTVFENVVLGAIYGARGTTDATAVSVAALEATDLIDRANCSQVPCHCSTASAWSWPARSPPAPGCCCSTRSPAG